MRNKKSYGINIGTSSILIIIVILCLVCFAALSIISANADYKLSMKLAMRTTSYYEASSKANEQIAKLNQEFSRIYESSSNEEEYLSKIKESFSDSLTFTYPINDIQSLTVSICPLYPSDTVSNFVEITEFKVVTINEPEMDNSLPLLFNN